MIILQHIAYISIISSLAFLAGAWWATTGAINKAEEGKNRQ